MADVYIVKGHTLTGLLPLVIQLRVEKEVTYQVEYTTDGIGRNSGGATATLIAEALDYDEAMTLPDQCGLSLDIPSALCTVTLPDRHRIPTPFYGTVTVVVGQTRAWWLDFRLEFNRLVKA